MDNRPLVTPEDADGNGSAPESAKKARRTRRAASRPSAKRSKGSLQENSDHRCVSSGVAFVILLAGLGLAAVNLSLMTGKAGALDGARRSWDVLMANYATRSTSPPLAPIAAPAPEPRPVALYSVVGGADLRPMFDTHLIAPLIDYHAAIGRPLEGLLVERKMASSRAVRVRLFFKDGAEQEFLWPFSAAGDLWWLPDCGEAKMQACPQEFLSAYPDIASAMKK